MNIHSFFTSHVFTTKNFVLLILHSKLKFQSIKCCCRYDEVCSHNFFNQAYQDKSGHFSQLVWNATRELGVGKAMGTKFGMNCTFIVARYRPLGNVGNEFATDVSKGNFDSSYCSHVQRDTLPRIDNEWKEYRYRAKIPRIKKIEIL